MSEQIPEHLRQENPSAVDSRVAGSAAPKIPARIVVPQVPGMPGGSSSKNTLWLTLAAVAAVALVAYIFIGVIKPSEPVSPGEWSHATLDDVNATTLYDYYVAKIDDDSIFEIIPRTDEGWAYFSAFMYRVTDYKAAESIGGPLTRDQRRDLVDLNTRFVNLEDLELTVDIKRSDGTQFIHDGKPPAQS